MAHQGSKIKDDDERFHMYQWIDKLEFWLLDLPKPDKTIFLHVPYSYAFELKKNLLVQSLKSYHSNQKAVLLSPSIPRFLVAQPSLRRS